VTSQSKAYPFKVAVPEGCGVTGVILADHVKSVDGPPRGKGRPVAADSLDEVLARLAPLPDY
jgi:mRNA interferase MazF